MDNLLKGLNIYLVGMMGSGKTTVGKILAQDFGYRFLDTDKMIEVIASKSIKDIFQVEGEPYFRDLETKVLAELSVYTRSVISTGGGIIQEQLNWSYLRHGLVVWLDVDIEIIKKRLARDNSRPLGNQLESLLEKRRSLYAQADLHISITKEQSPSNISAEIMTAIPSILKTKV